jgi:hypothetical protein
MRTATFDEKEWQIVPKKPFFLMVEEGDFYKHTDEKYVAMLAICSDPWISGLYATSPGETHPADLLCFRQRSGPLSKDVIATNFPSTTVL